MRNKLFLVLTVLFAFVASVANAQEIEFYNDNDDHGQGGAPVNPRSIQIVPFSANLTKNNTIEFTFKGKIGNTEIAVKDENGTVYYATTVNPAQTNTLTIDVSMLPAGEYTITVVNSTGDIDKYGKFVIQ